MTFPIGRIIIIYGIRYRQYLSPVLDGPKYKEGGVNMKTVQISLNSIDKVKSFVNDITKFDYDFDLVSGRYVIDAKSIMGIFSLDLSKPIDLNIHAEDNAEDVLAVIKPYMI